MCSTHRFLYVLQQSGIEIIFEIDRFIDFDQRCCVRILFCVCENQLTRQPIILILGIVFVRFDWNLKFVVWIGGENCKNKHSGLG